MIRFAFTYCLLGLYRKVILAQKFISSVQGLYHTKSHLASTNAASEVEESESKSEEDEDAANAPKDLQGIVMETAIINGLQMCMSMMKQSWMQLKWQEQLSQTLQSQPALPSLPSPPNFNMAQHALQMISDSIKAYPTMLFSKKVPRVVKKCTKELWSFLKWVVCAGDFVSAKEKQLAMEVMVRICLLSGSLSKLLEWIQEMLQLVSEKFNDNLDQQPLISVKFYQEMLHTIADGVFTYSAEESYDDVLQYSPSVEPKEGFAYLLDILVDLCKKLCVITTKVSNYFASQHDNSDEKRFQFLSKTSVVYAAGSNSSLQLALGSVEKIHIPRVMDHMADAQFIEAGLYCSLLVHPDGSVQGCGKGSNGRLGLGDSENRPNLTRITTFPEGVKIFQISQAKAGDGHCLAITNTGQVYSWGEGSYGRLGHGDTVTVKNPKRIEAFKDHVVVQVSSGSRHSAAITSDGVLFTWGSGTDGKLGHGNSDSIYLPKVTAAVDNAVQVACGASHTVAIAENGTKVYSWGGGSYGKLGHNNTNSQNIPKLVEALKSHQCVKVAVGSNYTAVLTSTGQILTMGNSSACGAGTSDPKRYLPEPVINLSDEHIIDISGGDTLMLALTLRGEVYSWGNNSMGQVGRGTDVGSTVSTPGKMLGLDGVSVQQISAGTSHSIMWTALPSGRRSTHVWTWPYCIDASEKTFKSLVSLLSTYGNLTSQDVAPPFKSRQNQWEFVSHVLKLTSCHVSLVAPVGIKCINQTLGSQVKPLREFVLKLFNSQEVPVEMQDGLIAMLQTGSTVLVPSIKYRLELMSTLMPQSPSAWSSLSKGQLILLKILLKEFTKSLGATAALVIEEIPSSDDDKSSSSGKLQCSQQIGAVLDLCSRMMQYIVFDTVMAILQLSAKDEEQGPSRCDQEIVEHFTHFVLSILYHLGAHCISVLKDFNDTNFDAMRQLDSVKKFNNFVNMLTEFVFQLVDKAVQFGNKLATQSTEEDSSSLKKLGEFLKKSIVGRVLTSIMLLVRCDDANWGTMFVELFETVTSHLQLLIKFVPLSLMSDFAKVEADSNLYGKMCGNHVCVYLHMCVLGMGGLV